MMMWFGDTQNFVALSTMMRFYTFFLFVVASSLSCLFAQGETYDMVYHTGPENGVLNIVASVFEDERGWLWIPSDEGLFGYDGARRVSIVPDASYAHITTGLKHCFPITDSDLLLLTVTDQLVIFNTNERRILSEVTISIEIGKEELFENAHFELVGNQIFLISSGIRGTRIFEIKDQELVHYIDLPKATFQKAVASDEALYSICDGELYILGKSKIWNKIDDFKMKQDGLTQFYFDKKEQAIMILNHCLKDQCEVMSWKVEKSIPTSLKVPFSLNLGTHFTVFGDEDDLWFAQIGSLQKVSRKNGHAKDYFIDIQSYCQGLDPVPTISHFTSIMKTTNGYLWLGAPYGLLQLVPKSERYKMMLRSDELFCSPFCSMRGIAKDDQSIYYAYYGGIAKEDLNTGLFTRLSIPSEFSLKEVYSASLNEDILLVNDLEINLRTNEVVDLIPDNLNGHVTNYIDDSGVLWLSTCCDPLNGVSLYRLDLKHGGLLTEIDIPEELMRSSQISSITSRERSDDIYLSTSDAGLFQINQDNLHVDQLFGAKEVQGSIQSMLIHKDDLWLGGNGAIYKYDLETHELEEFLFDLKTYRGKENPFYVVEEASNKLWWGTRNGLILFDLDNSTFQLTDELGLMGRLEFNRQSSLAFDGQMRLGTVNGVLSFSPSSVLEGLNEQKLLYPLSLPRFAYLDNKTNVPKVMLLNQQGGDPVQLNFNDKQFNFEISLPNYNPDVAVQYEYRILGFDDRFIKAKAPLDIFINHLDPGNYTLEVRGRLGNSGPYSQSLAIPMHISEAWYRTWLFYCVMGGAIFALGYGLFQYRFRQTRKVQELRNRISDDLHDEVGSILTGVAMQSELLATLINNDEMQPLADKISSRSRDALGRMRDTVWAINSNKDSIRSLEDRILDFLDETLSVKGIQYELLNKSPNKKQQLLPNVRQSIYLIFKEGITNILKHSNATEVKVILNIEKAFSKLIIHDNGDKKDRLNNSGVGLESIKRRVAKHNGQSSLSYKEGYCLMIKLQHK